MKNTPFIAVTSQPVPYHADTTAIFNTLCKQNSNSLLLDSAEIGSKNSLQSLILINAAVKITCLGNQVTFRALNANGKQVLNEIHPVLNQLGSVSAVNFDGVFAYGIYFVLHLVIAGVLLLHSVNKWKLSYNSLLILFFMAASLAVWAMFI